jgi:UDP-N-acetylglucosamine--N-acetylmuramyl-(pentapeptide) pyrophosphoryl-undecaprenol N-acetylglucosamine transferase
MKKIILAGGGTLGPTTPLLAVVSEAIRQNKTWQFIWIGTRRGPERNLVEKKMTYYWVPTAKLDRFVSLSNFLAPFWFAVALIKSFYLLVKIWPDLVVSAGGFNAVPVGYSAFILRIPILIHEQDVKVGLANKLLKPIATRRTCVFGNSGAEKIGNLIRNVVGEQSFELPEIFDKEKPYILVTGGGTGASSLNSLVIKALPSLIKQVNVLHLTGQGKSARVLPMAGYQQYEFLDKEMLPALINAEIVISRAGMGTLSELANLHKPAIVIPIPRTHQIYNAELLKQNGAAEVLDQLKLTPSQFAEVVLNLLKDPQKQEKIAQNLHSLIPGGTEKFVSIINELLIKRSTGTSG